MDSDEYRKKEEEVEVSEEVVVEWLRLNQYKSPWSCRWPHWQSRQNLLLLLRRQRLYLPLCRLLCRIPL